MHIAILHNDDFAHLPPGTGRLSQDSVLGVVEATAAALTARGEDVDVIPVGGDPVAFVRRLEQRRPDVVLNLCESMGGDARGEMLVPGLLDLLGLPYTGSGPLALALSLHKPKSKEILQARGVSTPEFAVVSSAEESAAIDVPLPVIVKPAREDASIGIDQGSVVYDRAQLRSRCLRVLEELRQPALVERYIEGRELNVGLLGDPPQALPIREIDFSRLDPTHPRIVTYAAKWDENAPEFHATPGVTCEDLPAAIRDRVCEAALAAFTALELRDYGRVDIRLSADGTPYVIEVNPNCDLSPNAGFAQAARAAGIAYDELIARLVAQAISHKP